MKAFYTSGMLFDVLTTFGELSEELVQNRKYAKWKAAYIHNCLKNGETPVPGPLQGEEEGFENEDEDNAMPSSSGMGATSLGKYPYYTELGLKLYEGQSISIFFLLYSSRKLKYNYIA